MRSSTVSIRASRVGRDLKPSTAGVGEVFQSARPVWDATSSRTRGIQDVIKFQSRASRVGRDDTTGINGLPSAGFNPRVRVGRDRNHARIRDRRPLFQSARPVWDATIPCDVGHRSAIHVSIRASRVGRDSPCDRSQQESASFNPRVPCGTRRKLLSAIARLTSCFNPRVPCGTRRHWLNLMFDHTGGFNPRVPCGTRRYRTLSRYVPNCFNPRVPCGTRLMNPPWENDQDKVSIRASRVGRDPDCVSRRCR